MSRGSRKRPLAALLEEMKRERGYLPAAWAYAAEKDAEFIEAYNTLYVRGLGRGKALPIKTRELIAIAVIAYRGNENGVYEHVKRALRHGATKQEILEALETAMIPGGVPTFGTGMRALMRVEAEEKANRSPGRFR